jgi:TrmH family RNA methyltransferase
VSEPTVLGARHPDVKRLRALLRDRGARDETRAFVLEGPNVVAGALDRGAALHALYLGFGARHAFRGLVERAEAGGVPVFELKEGVLEKVGTTRTPQPVLAVARHVTRPLADLPATGLVLVVVGVADPGNLGTLLRSAEASGAAGVVCTAKSVDVHNPKTVRSSAGALFGVTVAEEDDPMAVLATFGAAGRRRYATRADATIAYDAVDLARPCAVLLGNEAHGLDAALDRAVDEVFSIPMAGAAESLNVAMTGTVIAFEADRQRRTATPGDLR